jgi:prepilin-type N-terminal cleavage/methylation domain-containing protein
MSKRGGCAGFSFLKPRTRPSIPGGVRQLRKRARSDSGFTLVELLVALLVLSIVLAALGPAVMSLLNATGSTNHRSVANGLAVQATEQIRAVPYEEIGFATSGSVPSGCSNAVVLNTASTPIAGTSTPAPVGGVSYTIQTCISWVSDSSGNSQAYKQSVVTVSWTADHLSSKVSQTSAIYPGGLGGYKAANNGSLGSPGTTVVTGPPPNPPTNVTATATTSNTISVSWTPTTWYPVNGTNGQGFYVVVYTTVPGGFTSAPGGPSVTTVSYTPSSETTADTLPITVSPGETYYIQVEAFDTGVQQASAITSNTVTVTTPGSSSPTCVINSLVVSPSVGQNPNKGVAVDKNGNLVNESYFSLSVNAPSPCSNVTVAYAPAACTPGATGCTTDYATMTGTGGALYGNTLSGLTWSTGTQQFTVYQGSPSAQYQGVATQVQVCTENGNSGQC